MEIRLKRTSSGEERTLGALRAGGVTFATIERPWIPNPAGPGGMPRVSCVPLGVYALKPWNSPNFPRTFILSNPTHGVYAQPGDIPAGKPGRSAILIHHGNRVRDVIGCIAIGMDHGTLGGEPAVLRSLMAMRELNNILGSSSHTLIIE